MSNPLEQSDEGVSLKRTNIDVEVPVNCSVCLQLLSSGQPRGTADLQCGHQFHLACIGSAFNTKGFMECPNCRHIETGNWLYAQGSDDFDELSSDEALMAQYQPFYVVPEGYQFCVEHGIEDGNSIPVEIEVFRMDQAGNAIGQRVHPRPSLNLNEVISANQVNETEFDSTVFFGHTLSSSQGGSTFSTPMVAAASQEPIVNLRAYGQALAQQINAARQTVPVSVPFPSRTIPVRRDVTAYPTGQISPHPLLRFYSQNTHQASGSFIPNPLHDSASYPPSPWPRGNGRGNGLP